jgi:hypothetical protein
VFNPVEVRLVRVAEVSGRVELDGLPAPGGIRLVLETSDGRTHEETLTFADGSYTFERVFPGRYTLRVAATALSALAARATALTVQVPPSSSGEQSLAAPLLVMRTKP